MYDVWCVCVWGVLGVCVWGVIGVCVGGVIGVCVCVYMCGICIYMCLCGMCVCVYVCVNIYISKIFRRKDITLTRNRVIRICIQNTLVPPIAGYF